MRLQGQAKRLTIFIGESDHYHHHSLTTRLLSLSEDRRAGKRR
jgi:hypothetical protein